MFTLQQGGWLTIHKRRFFLKERLSAVYIMKLDFFLQGSGLDLTEREHYRLLTREAMKRVLLFILQ